MSARGVGLILKVRPEHQSLLETILNPFLMFTSIHLRLSLHCSRAQPFTLTPRFLTQASSAPPLRLPCIHHLLWSDLRFQVILPALLATTPTQASPPQQNHSASFSSHTLHPKHTKLFHVALV